MTAPARPVLVLDFDGTVCIGDGPVYAYGDAVAAASPYPDASTRMRAALDTYFAGGVGPDAGREPDGYFVVGRLARALEVDDDARSAAYLASRRGVDDGSVPIGTPDGLDRLLAELPDEVHVALVTNAPHDGARELLDRLGVGGHVDEVHGDAGKPAGMPGAIDRLLAAHGIRDVPGALCSVGDIWGNDLADPAGRGCATVLVDRFGDGAGAPDARAATLPDLYPVIRAWAQRAVELVAR